MTLTLSRSRRLWIGLGAAALLIGGIFVTVLPIIVRHVALAQLAKVTPRAIVLEDVDLNLFTRHLALKGFRVAQQDSPDAALAFERVDVRIAVLPLVLGHVRITELKVESPVVRVTRLGPDTFDFSDLLPPHAAAPREPPKPSRISVSLDKLIVHNLTVVARDRVVEPVAQWSVAGLSFEAGGLTTRTDMGPGRLTFAARVNGTPLTIEASGLELATGAATARVRLDGLPLASVAPYVPPTMAGLPRAGTLTLDVTAVLPRDGVLSVSGDIRVEGLEVVWRNSGALIVSVPRFATTIKRAEPGTRTVTLASVEIERLAMDVTRLADGGIDLLRLAPPAAPVLSAARKAAEAATAPAPVEEAPLRLTVERFAMTDAELGLKDETVTPAANLRLSGLSLGVRDLTWPPTAPAAIDLSTKLPGAGRVSVKGSVTPSPLDADVTVSLRDGSITPYGPYFPFKARFAGSFNADARWRVRVAGTTLTASSRGGRSWIDGLSVLDPDAPAGSPPVVRSDRLRFENIDFEWPKFARVTKVTVTRPDVRVEREKGGTISLNRVFAIDAPASAPAPSAPPALPPPPAAPARRSPPEAKPLPIALDVGALVVEQGFARFADHTLEPAYSETISGLAISVEGFSSTPGRRAKLSTQAVVGGNAALEVRGELAAFGRPYVDLTVELKDFALPSVTPYVDHLIAWKVSKGTMLARLHYTIDGDDLKAQHAVTLADFQVARSDNEERAQRRLGLPLSLIVALVKDGQGRIVLTVPVTGTVSDPQFHLGDAIWTAIRNVLVNIVAAPFRAIGRIFTGADDRIEKLAVDPVVFEAGSTTLAPAMEQHVLRVAGFLKGAPAITLSLVSATAPRDVESLRTQALTARLQALQREKKLKDRAAAVTAGYKARFPDVKKVPPTDEAFAQLLEGEPAPDAAAVAELRARRLTVVREALAGPGGVEPTRLLTGEPAPDAEAEGRVDFSLGS